MTVAQWHIDQIIRGLWLLAKKVEDGSMLMWCNFIKFDGVRSIWTLIEECSSIK